MLAVALGLGSALCWGVADFIGGLSSRRLPVFGVMLASQLAGTAVLLFYALASGAGAPDSDAVLPAALGGLAGVVALGAFYRALAIGTMSIVAPISATGAIVPVAVGLLSGEQPSALQIAGIVAALAGVVLASREAVEEEDRRADSRASIWLALVAALGIGTFLALLDEAAEVDVLSALMSARIASSALLVAALVAIRPATGLDRAVMPQVIAVGLLDVTANGLYAVASTEGLVSIVAVLGSLYPLSTVLLARAVLGERIRRIQAAGVLAALGGVALMAAG